MMYTLYVYYSCQRKPVTYAKSKNIEDIKKRAYNISAKKLRWELKDETGRIIDKATTFNRS